MKAFSSTLALLTILSAAVASAAPVNVTYSTATQGTSLRYNYFVNDTSVPNLLSVTLQLPAAATQITNLTAPAGYSIFFDSGNQMVDFVEDTSTFTVGSTVGAFGLTSPVSLGAVPFSALSLDTLENPVTTTGTAVVAAAPIPEPAAFSLLALGLTLLLVRAFQRIA